MTKIKLSDTAGFGILLAAVGAVTWGSFGVFMKTLSGYGFQDVTLVNIAACAGVIGFFFTTLFSGGWKAFKIQPLILILFIVHGFVIINGANFAYVKAYKYLPIGVVSIIVFCNAFVVMGLCRIFYKQPITPTKIVAAILGLIGLILVLKLFESSVSALTIRGILWTFGVVICYSIAFTLIPFYLKNGAGVDVQMFYVNLFAAIFMWVYNPPWKLIGEMHQVAHNRGPVVWLVLLGFTTVTQIISAKSQVAAYYYVEPTYVSAVLALDPVTATILGFFIFHQILTLPQIAGVLIVLGAVVYLHLKESKEEPALESVLESERVKSTRIVMPKIHSTAMSKR